MKIHTQMLKLGSTIMLFMEICIFTQCNSPNSLTTIEKIKQQLIKKDDILAGRFPNYTENGKWIFSKRPNWFSGFTGGELWYMYDITGDETLKARALKHANQLIPYATLDNTHDMGFIFLPSCVKAYQETHAEKYRQAGIQAAEMLSKRFNKNGKFIRAWGKLGEPDRAGWMIIDTMMNLELLFWAAQETGNREYYNIARLHATTAMNEIVRENGSSYHVIEWDPQTGALIKKRTHQGYRDESTWARGQAWGIYGFANCYRRTQDTRFLQTAIKMTDYLISFLPADDIPYWDLDLSGDDVLRDASAGAIAASGMFLLADLVKTDSLKEKYLGYAEKMTVSLIHNYLFTTSSRATEQGLLLHCIYNYNKKRAVDESYPAGDYYFIEAVKKLWDKNKSLPEQL